MKVLNIGYVSCSPCFGLQYMLAQEGHTLHVVIDAYEDIPDYPNIKDSSGLDNIFPNQIYISTLNSLRDCDFIFVDYNDVKPGLMDKVRDLGRPVVGPDDFTDLLEENRAFGKRIAGYCGLQINEGSFFREKEAAVAYLKELPPDTQVFLKGSVCSLPTYNTEDAIHLVSAQNLGMFEAPKWNTNPYFAPEGVYIDTKVTGREVAYGAFWSSASKSWGPDVVFTREFKHAMPNGQGNILTGEIGTAFAFLPFEDMPVAFTRAFERLGLMLKNTEFSGFIDINCIVNQEGTWFLEWTTRPGYPTELEIAGWHQDQGMSYGHWLMGIATGNFVKMNKGYGLAASLFSHGLGLLDYEKLHGVQPIVHGLDTLSPRTAVLPFDLTWGEDKVPRIGSWDRGVFLARYQSDPAWRTLAVELAFEMNKLHAWGHMWRPDLAADTIESEINFTCVPGTLRDQHSKIVPIERNLSGTTWYKDTFDEDLVCDLYSLELRGSGREQWEYGNFYDERQNELFYFKSDAGYMLGAVLIQNNYISYVMVDPEARKSGIGSLLVNLALIKIAQNYGTVHLDALDEYAVTWYQKKGFYLDGKHEFSMTKNLNVKEQQ